MEFFMPSVYGQPFTFFLQLCDDFYVPVIRNHYPEFLEEMQGISDGAGAPITLSHIVFINTYMSIPYLYPKLRKTIGTNKRLQNKYHTILRDIDAVSNAVSSEIHALKDRCSAVIATGDYTKDGRIVCAHSSFSNFVDAASCNVVLSIDCKPHGIIMQTFPGGIYSGTDFFVTTRGIIGTETTIADFDAYAHRHPICCRIRTCMQYGDSLEDYQRILCDKKTNSGDYACSWLFGDTRATPNRIMRVELGLNYHNVESSTNGYFIGFNIAFDERIRNIECQGGAEKRGGMVDEHDLYNVASRCGNRHVRLRHLVEKYKGRIDAQCGQSILGDHHDYYLKRTCASGRTVCNHSYADKDARKAYLPFGAYDGKVCDAGMAEDMRFLAHWGPPCGGVFNPDAHVRVHPEWDYLLPHLANFPKRPWGSFAFGIGIEPRRVRIPARTRKLRIK